MNEHQLGVSERGVSGASVVTRGARPAHGSGVVSNAWLDRHNDPGMVHLQNRCGIGAVLGIGLTFKENFASLIAKNDIARRSH